MEVEFAFLAEAARVPPDGKLYVFGGSIDRFHSTQFPIMGVSVTLVIKIEMLASECNRPHQLHVDLWDPRGNPMLEPSVDFEIGVQPDPDDPNGPNSLVLPISLMGLQFPNPGVYEFHIVINGRHLKTVRVRMVQVADDSMTISPPTA